MSTSDPDKTPRRGLGARRKERIDELAATSGTATATVDEAGTIEDTGGVGLVASAWARLRRNPIFLIGLGITTLFVLLAILAPVLAPHDPASWILKDQIS